MDYYVFEGADGCGKSTVAQQVYKRLQKSAVIDHKRLKYVREPDGMIRKAIMEEVPNKTELLLFFADRIKQFNNLEEDDIVIADRSFISSYVYQHKYKKIDGFKFLLDYADLPKINVLFILNTPKRFGEKENRLDETDRDIITEFYNDIKTDKQINTYFDKCLNLKNINGEINEVSQNCLVEILKDLGGA